MSDRGGSLQRCEEVSRTQSAEPPSIACSFPERGGAQPRLWVP